MHAQGCVGDVLGLPHANQHQTVSSPPRRLTETVRTRLKNDSLAAAPLHMRAVRAPAAAVSISIHGFFLGG